MASLSSILITLPVIILPVTALAVKPAMSEVVSSVEAVEILVKSKAASAKCRILSRSEQSELEQYTARAEVAAVQRIAPDEAHAAVAAGTASGKSAPCGDKTAGEVREALEAAREAMAQLQGNDRRRGNRAPEPLVRREAVTFMAAPGEPPGGLARFQRNAMAYYVDQRCRFLPYSKAKSFWMAVIGGQSAAIKANGRKPVGVALNEARRTAAQIGCDKKSARLVKSTFATVASN